MTSLSRRLLPVVLVFVLGSLWGLHFSLIKIVSESGLAAPLVTAVITCGVSVIYLLISLLRRRLPPFTGTAIVFYASCAVLGYVLPIIVELFVARHMAAGLLTLIVSTTPIFTLFLALMLNTEAVSKQRIAGIAVGAVAALLILLPQVTGAGSTPAALIILTVAVPLSYGLFHNYVARAWPTGMDTWQLGAGQMTLALLMMLPLYLAFHGTSVPAVDVGRAAWLAIAAMIVFAVLEVYLYFTIIRMAGAVVVSLSNFVTIAAGVMWGMLIFAEQPGLWDWLCVAVLMLSLAMVIQPAKPESDPQ